jgi:serine/threonine-protein kinase
MKLRLEISLPQRAPFLFEHAGPAIRIGRDPSCELHLTGDTLNPVSRNHARIDLTSRGPCLSDLNSSNGTYLNGQRLGTRAVLKPGDRISLGKTGPKLRVLEIQLDNQAVSTQKARVPSRAPIIPEGMVALVPAIADEQPAPAAAGPRRRFRLPPIPPKLRMPLGVLGAMLLLLIVVVLLGRKHPADSGSGSGTGDPKLTGGPVLNKIRPPRVVRSPQDILALLRAHLEKLPNGDRRHQRYFTLANLANNPQVTDDDLDLHRAALSKLLNSLSWEGEIHVPQALDVQQTVFAIDLRRLGWDRTDAWTKLTGAYPYGLRYDAEPDEKVRKLAGEVYQLTETQLPAVRADWFIARGSQPPLYHDVLGLPRTADDLEKKLEVDFRDNFLNAKLDRAGVRKSGFNGQNRLLERHAALYGAYWKTYDFETSVGRKDIAKFPLGPAFFPINDNPFPDHIFQHDGSEMLFNLPNGLQAYFLTDNRGIRMDVALLKVARDNDATFGSPLIVNGLSCMNCHKQGIIPIKDSVRKSADLDGGFMLEIEWRFPEPAKLAKIFQKDQARFQKAAAKAMGEFLEPSEKSEEPIGFSARRYLVKDVTPVEAGFELGLKDGKLLKEAIEKSPRLRDQLGLRGLAEGPGVKRAVWDAMPKGPSPFQEVARELKLGTPVP